MLPPIGVSNLAWLPTEEKAAASMLQSLGIQFLEIAPTRSFSSSASVTFTEISAYRKFWEERGIKIHAMQSLLYGRPDLALFETEEKRRELIVYLCRQVDLAADLGAKVLVFGSPRNRRRGRRSPKLAWRLAAATFRELAEYARIQGCQFCIEPTPAVYGCDFVINAEEGDRLVKDVNAEGFGLHLDVGCLLLGETDPVAVVKKHGAMLSHFHLSGPYLEVPDLIGGKYAEILAALADAGYGGVTSVEMLPTPDALSTVRSVLERLLVEPTLAKTSAGQGDAVYHQPAFVA